MYVTNKNNLNLNLNHLLDTVDSCGRLWQWMEKRLPPASDATPPELTWWPVNGQSRTDGGTPGTPRSWNFGRWMVSWIGHTAWPDIRSGLRVWWMPSSTHRPPRCEWGYTCSAGPAWKRCGLHGVPRGRLGPGEVDTTASQSVSSGLGSRCRVDEVTGDVDGRMKSCWRASWI